MPQTPEQTQAADRQENSTDGRTKVTSTAIWVLFLCTHNSSRSQMAEGLLKSRGGSRYQAFSAGTHPRAVHPLAIRAMAELGIDISAGAGHYAKSLHEFEGQPIDLVVTVCDEAAKECPFFPGAHRQEHWGFPDPSAAIGTEEERLVVFRQVRDAIAARISRFLTLAERPHDERDANSTTGTIGATGQARQAQGE